jgi:DNA-binding Xre family transcriptional regulator
MAIVWNLKKWLAVNRDIYRPSELQLLIAERVGVRLSLQAISAIINGQPSALRLQTIQALCTALDCKLSEFCDVLPEPRGSREKTSADKAVPIYGLKRAVTSPFPDPRAFTSKAKARKR